MKRNNEYWTIIVVYAPTIINYNDFTPSQFVEMFSPTADWQTLMLPYLYALWK